MMLCPGKPARFDNEDHRAASNFEIVSAFSLAPTLAAHGIINADKNELFVAASSCRNAKIMAIYQGHLEAIACGRCSHREAEELLSRAPAQFREALESSSESGEPRVLWRSGYIAEEGRRVATERMATILMRRPE
jgi:hypothetical protein